MVYWRDEGRLDMGSCFVFVLQSFFASFMIGSIDISGVRVQLKVSYLVILGLGIDDGWFMATMLVILM